MHISMRGVGGGGREEGTEKKGCFSQKLENRKKTHQLYF